jgi:predicted unusual protein kinase regulating ubiquinone biosynthesis (AarF/ABC1/UbiB family)
MKRPGWLLGAAGVSIAGGVVAVSLARRRSERAVPLVGALEHTGRKQRNAQLIKAGARSGRDYASMRVRSALAGEDRRAELAAEFELRTAEAVAESLGQMKGALMKLGQMASYLDQGLPEHVRDALAQLQSDAPPMAAELVGEVVAAELGAPPEALFAQFDPVPIASASIGQVHRATTHDGRAVAVKVQYPGVDEAIAADLENTDMLFSVLSMLFAGMDPEPIVAELRERLVEELDYRVEADNQQLFAEAYRGHPYIHVPDVLDELSSRRVLTTEFADGVRFSKVLAWSDEERQLAAETLYRFAFGSIYGLAAFNGDPHPGNYLFQPGGRVTFLDFGLCKRFTPEEVDYMSEMTEAMAIEHDIGKFRKILTEIQILPEEVTVEGRPVTEDELAEYFGHFWEFVLHEGEAEMTPEYASQSVRRFFDLSAPHAAITRQANLPPFMVIVQRINLGLFALFGDLRARNDWRAIAEDLWPFAEPSSLTPMGERIAEWEAQRT